MIKEVIWIVGFLLGICVLSAEEKIGKVYLEVIDQPIIFGESVKIFCNLSLVPDCCRNTVTWMRNLDVIVHHAASFDASKYEQIPAQTGFSLQINNFAETDLNAKFSCLYGFEEDSIVLGMEKNKYERHPSSDEIKINEYLDKKHNVFKIDIVFERVLPMPNCILISNDRDLEATVVIKKHNIGMFYKVLFRMKLKNTFHDCPNNITLKCSIGGYNMSRALKHVIPCSGLITEVPYNNSDHKNDAEVIKMICLLIVVLLSVVIIILRLRHVYLSSKRQRQGDRLESMKIDQQGPVLESKSSTKTHGHMNKSSNARSWSASHSPVTQKEKGKRHESISLLETHERGDRLESIETDEQSKCERQEFISSMKTHERVHLLKKETEDQHRKDDTNAQAQCIKTNAQGERLESMETDEQVHLLKTEREAQYRTDDNLPIQKKKDLKKVFKNFKRVIKGDRQELIPSWKTHEREHLRKRRQAEYRTDENLPVQQIEEVHKWKKSHKYN